MPTVPRKRLHVVIILLLVLLIAAGVVFYLSHQQTAPGSIGGSKTGEIVTVDPSRIPPGFPNDVPLFSEIKILQNYNASVNGKTQATRQFNTSLTGDVAYKEYVDYFLKAGWNVTPQYRPKIVSQLIFYAVKGNENANVIVDSVLTEPRDNAPRQTIVTISFITESN